MAKRKSNRRRSGSSIPILLVLLVVASAAGWFLLRPASHRPARTTIGATTATPEATPVPAQTQAPATPPETAVPEKTSTPEASPSVSASPVANPNAPKLAIIIDDCGQWLSTERAFIALGIPITLSVLPDVHGTATIAQEAHDAGKGVMLHLPMETLSGMNPGPGKVTTEMSDAEITAQVEDDLAQVPLATGVNNHEGSKASADRRVMTDVVNVLVKHGNLFFIDSRTNAASVAAQVAAAAGIKTASRDVFLDNKADVDYSEAQLRQAAAIAKRTGSAIAIGHPKPTTLEAVKALIPQLQADGIEFVLAQDLTR